MSTPRTRSMSKRPAHASAAGAVFVFILAAALPMNAGSAAGQAFRETEREPFRVMLRSEAFHPGVMNDAELASALASLTDGAAAGQRVHLLLQLANPTSRATRATLEARGVSFVSYLPHDTWIVSLPAGMGAEALAGETRWIGGLEPRWKMTLRLAETGVPAWSRTEDGRALVLVKFMRDVPLAGAAEALRAAGVEVRAERRVSHGFEVAVEETRIAQLARRDDVLYVSELAPPKEVENDGSRDAVSADVVQAPPLSLDGAGVVLAEWDGGRIDPNHDDFAGRLLFVESASTGDHGTHVAGTMAGSGALSASRGGTPLQWRGMAPAAGILSYYWDDFLDEYDPAINDYGAVLGQNSWGYGISESSGNCDLYGDYSYGSPELDDIITGFYGAPVMIVFSAGNERNDGDCGIAARGGYACIGPLKTAKNVITVGATYSDTDGMTSFSSWGPIDDGRLKPDVCAPGCEQGGEGYIKSTWPGDTYGAPGYCGTSMAAPAASGCAGLLVQLWRDTYGPGDPLPSTVKAFLLNTADDLGNVGPDYAFGHGRINVAAAADLMLSAGAYVDAVDQSETDEVTFNVPAVMDEDLRVILVWDDPPGLELADPALVNDLDFVLEDPFGGLHYPWILDPDNPADPATRGIDHINNVEAILVASPAAGTWIARVTGFNVPQGPQSYSLVGVHASATDVSEEEALPRVTALLGAGVNPMRPGSTIRFALPARGDVSLTVYDAAGRRVRELANGIFEAGVHARPWDARDDYGRPVASGIYFVRFERGETREVSKITLVR